MRHPILDHSEQAAVIVQVGDLCRLFAGVGGIDPFQGGFPLLGQVGHGQGNSCHGELAVIGGGTDLERRIGVFGQLGHDAAAQVTKEQVAGQVRRTGKAHAVAERHFHDSLCHTAYGDRPSGSHLTGLD